MNTVVIACQTLEDEIVLAQKNAGTELPVKYMESGLHERPKKLAEALKALIKEAEEQGFGRALLCLGQCGNSLCGISSDTMEIVLPKVDDCLSLLIGSTAEKARIGAKDKAFFLTMGWLRGESTIMSQYERSAEKYDEETAISILEMMYANYRTIGLIDAGSAPIDTLYEKTADVAKLLGLERRVYPGTTKYIENLLTGPWPAERFITKQPGQAISELDFR